MTSVFPSRTFLGFGFWLFVFVSLPGCAGTSSLLAQSHIALTSPSGENILLKVEVADDDESRERGLMFRTHLDLDAGMLFVFDEAKPLSFWMKNTLIPLDILYFDSEGMLVSAVTMTPCTADPCATYPSGGSSLYALEVPSGFIENHQIGQGWHISRLP